MSSGKASPTDTGRTVRVGWVGGGSDGSTAVGAGLLINLAAVPLDVSLDGFFDTAEAEIAGVDGDEAPAIGGAAAAADDDGPVADGIDEPDDAVLCMTDDPDFSGAAINDKDNEDSCNKESLALPWSTDEADGARALIAPLPVEAAPCKGLSVVIVIDLLLVVVAWAV